MTVDINQLDAHEQPSDELRARWKRFAKTEPKDLRSEDIDDLQNPSSAAEFCVAGNISAETLKRSFRYLCPSDTPNFDTIEDIPIYYHPILPGLLIVPSLVPSEVQKILLRRLIHRDLSNPTHQTNLHLHFDLPYPKPTTGDDHDGDNNKDSIDASFFSYSPTSPPSFIPKDPTVHKPLTIRQVLERKLHWVTLGGQYDWTKRVYPEHENGGEGGRGPPAFPPDVAGFLETLFPETRAEAAIVNFYSPGDTMMMHRDVSEETDRGLVSLSLGCEGLFMISPNNEDSVQQKTVIEGRGGGRKEFLLLRLRSGDAIYMTKESRFAWHGVPKVLRGTCPDYLEDWPAEDGKYEEWRGWMRNKRINLNVRQMRD